MKKYSAKSQRIANEIVEAELTNLRQAITKLPANDRGGFARLAVLVLLLDMAEVDRAITLALLRGMYFPITVESR